MKPRTLYLILCVAGALLPCVRGIRLLSQYGMFSQPLWEQLFSTWASGLSSVDVIVSSVVLWVFIYLEGRRSRMQRLWFPVAASLMLGIAFALPLFLYLREARIQGSMWSGGRCEV